MHEESRAPLGGASFMETSAIDSHMVLSKSSPPTYHNGAAGSLYSMEEDSKISHMEYSKVSTSSASAGMDDATEMVESKVSLEYSNFHDGDENVNNHTSPSFPSPKKMSSLKPRSQLKRPRDDRQDESASTRSPKVLARSPKKIGQRKRPQSGHKSPIRQRSHQRSNKSSSIKKNLSPQSSTKSPSNKKKRRKMSSDEHEMNVRLKRINVSSQSDEVSELGDWDGASRYPTPLHPLFSLPPPTHRRSCLLRPTHRYRAVPQY